MASRPRRSRRLLLPAILGAILAGEITGIALARTLPPVIVPVAAPVAPGPDRAAIDRAPDVADRTGPASAGQAVHVGVNLESRLIQVAQKVAGASLVTKAAATSTPVRSTSSSRSGSSPASTSFRGTNHVWIPSLGINRSVQFFPCSRTRPPDAGVYRWGCSGRNNVYLMSHAWSTFRPLHDAYVRGTLRKGMRVWYADGSGRTHQYRVIWWRVTAPTTAASWAWASLSSPGMTLQTCVGANSEYRLMVRLDRVD